jgi:hypothetical protein
LAYAKRCIMENVAGRSWTGCWIRYIVSETNQLQKRKLCFSLSFWCFEQTNA